MQYIVCLKLKEYLNSLGTILDNSFGPVTKSNNLCFLRNLNCPGTPSYKLDSPE